MKEFKIFLTILAIAAIGIATAILTGGKIEEPTTVEVESNQYIKDILDAIAEIEELDYNKLNANNLTEVDYRLKEYSKPSQSSDLYGKLGESQKENEEMYNQLRSNLYAAYTQKFIEKAQRVFHPNAWEHSDLIYVSNEIDRLKKSGYIHNGSEAEKSLDKYSERLSRYNEVIEFISQNQSFTYSDYALSKSFPGSIKQKVDGDILINRDKTNSVELIQQLNELPLKIIQAHETYLSNKISYWSNMFENFASYDDYKTNLYDILKLEIINFRNGNLSIGEIDRSYNQLINKLDKDAREARIYFS